MDPLQQPQQPQQPLTPPIAPQPPLPPQSLPVQQPAPQVVEPLGVPVAPVPQPEAPQAGPVVIGPAPSPVLTGPQPIQGPVQPQPFSPAPQQPMSFSSMNSSSKKKTIIKVAAIAAVAAVTIGASVFGYLSFTGISREEYRKASTAASTAQSELSDLNLAVNRIDNTYSTETEINNNISAVTTAIKDYKDASEKMGQEKAAKKGETAKLYQAFKEKNDKFIPMTETYTASASKVMLGLRQCSEALEGTTSTETSKLGNCVTTLSAVNDVSDTDLKGLLDASVVVFKEMKSLLEQLNATPSSNFNARSQLRTKYYDALESYSTKARDFSSNVEKKFNDADPSKELRAYYDAVFNESLKK